MRTTSYGSPSRIVLMHSTSPTQVPPTMISTYTLDTAYATTYSGCSLGFTDTWTSRRSVTADASSPNIGCFPMSRHSSSPDHMTCLYRWGLCKYRVKQTVTWSRKEVQCCTFWVTTGWQGDRMILLHTETWLYTQQDSVSGGYQRGLWLLQLLCRESKLWKQAWRLGYTSRMSMYVFPPFILWVKVTSFYRMHCGIDSMSCCTTCQWHSLNRNSKKFRAFQI